jgi:hypothetical protein
MTVADFHIPSLIKFDKIIAGCANSSGCFCAICVVLWNAIFCALSHILEWWITPVEMFWDSFEYDPVIKGIWWLYMIIVMLGIVDTVHCFKLQITHNVFDDVSTFLIWLNLL